MIMALDDPNSVQLTAALGDMSDTDMNEDWNGPWPSRYIARVIDFKEVVVGQDPELHACFRDNLPAQPLPAGGITQAIKDLFKPIVLLPNPLASRAAAAGAGAAAAAALADGYLRSPLDLEVLQEPAYIIFILGRPANLYFRPGVKAITHKNGQDRPHYGALRHIRASATTYEDSEIGLDDCVIISFIAYPPQAPVMPPPPEFRYAHGFTLHVRLRQPPDSDNNPRVLDIDIDPDIRYPGQ
jgi:hypothetical protein